VTDTPENNAQIARAVGTLEKKLGVQLVNKTNLIAVKYESPDPELAGRVLTALTNFYLEKHLAVHRPPGAFDFFQQETQQYGKGLADAEAQLVNFTHGAAVVSAKLEKEVALQKLAEFDATLSQTHAAIAETQQRIRVLDFKFVQNNSRSSEFVDRRDPGGWQRNHCGGAKCYGGHLGESLCRVA